MSSTQSSSTIEETFGDAQHAVEQAWDLCLRSIHECRRDAIAAHFSEFASRLRRQIRLEEELLFPALAREAKVLENDPIVLMRAEHRDIEATLGILESKINAHDCAALYGQHVGPSSLFRAHLNGEQNVLYPLADLLIPPSARAQIVEAMRIGGTA